jgi:acetylornithine/succinyldiaminopimelate/putrescine aminotransferase
MGEPALAARARANAPALLEVYEQIPVRPVRGEGVFLFTAEGERFLDFYGGHAVAALGYGHPSLVEALQGQARTLFFQSNLVPLDVRERAAEALARFAPPGLSRVFFVNSGAEANENALRIAFRATGRPRVVAVEGAFHGRTAAAGAVTAGHERWYAFPGEPFPVTWVPFDDAPALESAVTGEVAAVIVEPVQGVAGARALSEGFLRAARTTTSAAGSLLIFDEVQCGMGRTGYPFAAQAFAVTPDVLTTAKGLAGGFPAGAVLLGEELAACLGKGDLGTTFGGGPLAMALVEAVVRTIESEGLLANVRRLSARLRSECVVGPVTAVQGLGFLLGLRTRPPAKEVLKALRERRVLAGSAADPHVVRLLPPLVLQDGHVDELAAALREIPG